MRLRSQMVEKRGCIDIPTPGIVVVADGAGILHWRLPAFYVAL
jgi:hypothetical protein